MINNKENKTKFEKRNIRLRTFAGVVGLSFFSLTTTLLFLNKPQKTEAAWWESSWRYRQRIAIQYSGVTSLENYQVLLNDVNTSALVTAGKLQSDCDDLRFAGADGVQYDYWIESGCNTTTTDIWVEVNRINAPGKEIYMYYGNPTAPIGSNGKETFLMFEDFVGESIASLETQGWTKNYTTNLGMVSPPAYSIVDNQLFIDNNYGYGMWAYFVKESNLTEAVFRSRVKQTGYYLTTATRTGMSFRTIPNVTTNAAPTQQWYFAFEGASVDYLHSGNGVSANGTVTSSQNVWYVLETVASSTSSMAYRDSTYFSTVTASSQTGGMGAMQYEAEAYYDFFLARAYAATEPTINALGTEEVSKEPILHLSFDEGYGTTAFNNSSTQAPRDYVARWKLDETNGTTAYDETQNNNDGTLVATPVAVVGSLGYSRDFESTSSQYIYMADSTSLSITGALTLSAWIKPESVTASTYFTIAAKYDARDDYRLTQFGDEVRFYVENESLKLKEAIGTTSLNLTVGSWYHVVGIYNPSIPRMDLLVNGVILATSTDATRIPTSLQDTTKRFHIGAINSSTTASNFYDGVIDDVRLYNYALTSDQISAMYQEMNGMMINMDESTDWIQGVNGTALDFDGTNDYVDTGDRSEYAATTSGVTYSAWIYPTAYPAAHGMIMSKNLPYFSFRSTGGLTFSVSVAGTQRSLTTAASVVPLNAWSYVVGNIDSSGYLRIYVNGNLITTSPQYTGTIANVAQILAVGRHGSSSSYYFTGRIDEAKVYNYARSAAEIKTDYNAYKSKTGSGVGMGGQTPSQSSAEKPILWYDFNSETGTSIYDQSGSANHGLMTNMDDKTDYVNGKYGKALDFDGTDDYVATSNESALEGMTGITVSAWVKRTSNPAATGIIASKFWDGTNRSWRLAIGSTGIPEFLAATDTQNDNDRAYGNTALTIGQWYYVTGMWSSTTGLISLYVDGILQNTTAQAGSTIRTNNSPAWVARDYYNNVPRDPFPGQIDDLKVYNYARTADQIHEDMNGSPITYWKFDEGYGTTVYDSMGNKNGTMANMDASTDWVKGNKGNALDFDGLNDVLHSGTSYNNGDEFTWSIWIKPTSYTGIGIAPNWQLIMAQYHYDGGNNWGIRYNFNYNGNYQVTIKRTSGYTTVSYPSSNIPVGEWSQLAFTYSKTSQEVNLYLNGKQVATGSNAGESVLYSASDTYNRIGIANRLDHNGYCPYLGQVDEVKVYNYALTEDEMKSDYNGSGGSPSFDGTSVSYGVEDTETIGFTMPEPIAYWNFDEGSGTSLQDVSSGGNTGTLTNMDSSTDWVSAKYGKGLDFDGSNDYVIINDDTTIKPTDISVSAWFNSRNVTTNQRIISKTEGSGYQLSLNENSACPLNTLCFVLNLGGTYYSASYATSNLTNDTWYHATGTFDGSTINLYLNGQLVGTTAQSGTITHGAYPLCIGSETTTGACTGGQYFNGKIDDVKIFDEALSQSQVAWEYNQGKPIFHMKLDQSEFFDCNGSASGTADVCESMFGNHGTAYGSMTDTDFVAGKFGQGLELDGTDDYVARTTIALSGANESFFMWFNSTTTSSGFYMHGSSGWSRRFFASNMVIIDAANVYNYYYYPTGYNDGNWHQVGYTFDGTNLRFYFDGNLKQTTASGNVRSDTGNLYIGRICSGSSCENYYNGKVDDIRIYNYARTSEQVKQDYLNGAAVMFQ